MDVIDCNNNNIELGTKEKSWGMAIDSLSNKMYVSNVRWLDNIVIDLNDGNYVGQIYLPEDYPGASMIDAMNIRDYVDSFP